MTESNEKEPEETPEEHRAFVDKVAGVLASKGLEVQKNVPIEAEPKVPINRVQRGEYGCDYCNEIDVPRFYLVRARPRVDFMLCGACKDKREKAKGVAPVVAIFEVAGVAPKPIDVTAIVNKPEQERKAEIKGFLDGVIGDYEKRSTFKSFNGDAVRALMPRRPILLNADVSLTFELESVDIAACTLPVVSKACDAVENKPEWSKLTIIPPVEGTTRFEVVVDEDGVSIDLPALKQALVEALEAAV
jgi:hypothetical protein